MEQHNLVTFNGSDFILDVQVENETVWLSQVQMSDLFNRDATVIKRHINNIYK